MNPLPFYDDRHVKTKTRRCGDDIYTNFRGLNLPNEGVECKLFTIISIDSLLVSRKEYCLQVYFDNCVHKLINTEMVDYFDDNLFKTYYFLSFINAVLR